MIGVSEGAKLRYLVVAVIAVGNSHVVSIVICMYVAQ